MIDSGIREVLDLAVRWLHVIAGILWIGNSMLWNWIDRNLEKPADPNDGSIGRIWLLHSGAFYYMEKTLLRGKDLPKPLHWFKWQAYTTWMSGAALLVIVYYLGGAALLVRGDSGIHPHTAIAISAGLILLSWPVYDLLWRSPIGRSRVASGLFGLGALMGIGYGLTQVFSARAAFLQIGAMMATIMAGNVFRIIMPSQRQLVAAVAAREDTVPALAARAKARSIHNNYLTFPVIVLMVSSHFPAIYGNRWNWLLLGVLIVAGAGVRHFMNIRFTEPRWRIGLATTVIATLVVLTIATRPQRSSASSKGAPVSFADARSVVDRRCAACHSSNPSDDVFRTAPLGVKFDTPEEIRAMAPRILQRAVRDRTMPLGNKTKITDEEREVLRLWIESGAR